ncbi:MAG TPA: DUF72 domain-containing protein [Nocardia sp.]|uniref:DUF72 domain-containing protein n=1 Tax=Nocardia sp. TaxID=1821 RepID=UPI002B4ADB6F|nr:DUF72 domain-containing protein [Nocardia sp.]HLS76366.1 DUF72 domain-containing protein [Nocardia sp.]
MRLYVGCAMWTHPDWQERQLPPAQRLRWYAGHCNAVEGNTTFYATPSPATVRSWAEQTGTDFRFAAKLPKPITHERRLAGADAELAAFLDAMAPLGERLHTLWVQLPGSFGPGDLGALARFLPTLPSGPRRTVEVRHRGFYDDPRAAAALERVLARADAEWATFDTSVLFSAPASSPAELEARAKKPHLPRRTRALTADPMVRYHGRDDEEVTVTGWQPWLPVVADWLREGRSPTVFVHTPDNGSSLRLARRFHDEVRALVPELEPLPDPAAEEPMTLF